MTKPTLFGYGLTTKAIAHTLGGGCTFYDDKTTKSYEDEAGNTIHPSKLFDPKQSHLEVTTPSLPPSHPLIQSAQHLLSEYDYFAKEMPFSIWISGTNGKTTTTQMLTHLLAHKGAVSGGNIGTPLAALDHKANIWILESSSYTLEHTKIASPNIYLLLPITPDHLDWHGDFDAYSQAKLSPITRMKEGELALIPKGLTLPKTSAYVVEYDSDAFLCEYFALDSTKLHYKGVFLQDALLSLAMTKVLFDKTDYDLMNTFQRDAHRQEEIYDDLARLWVNDSKATNVDASIQAIQTYSSQKIHLILGGEDKGMDLKPLFMLMQDRDILVYAIGKNSQTLESLATLYGIQLQISQTLAVAVEEIAKVLTQEEVALLSPSSASFDQFTSYIHRGESFIELVKTLKK
ncbi:MAG: UDP-N-acetylmuramoyl-L-alanine--D-glutamate ligase [Sulfurovum sp.]|nr:UDP-N-acetylmuramoyl-L-alanine--D-glutamate ligase [Sulfurovum sp.]